MAVDKKINYAIQGGGPNYLGKQKMVKAPKKWKSSPTHPEAHLAYITDKEQDLLIKKNLYGSLKGKPNRGPSGIVSLQGDLGGYSGGQGGGKSGGGEGKGGAGSGSSTPWRDTKQYQVLTRGQYNPKTQSFKDDRIARGARGAWSSPHLNPDAQQFGFDARQINRRRGIGGLLGALGRGALSLFGGIPGKIASGIMTAKNWAGNQGSNLWSGVQDFGEGFKEFKEYPTLEKWWNRDKPEAIKPIQAIDTGQDPDLETDQMKEFRMKYPLDLTNANAANTQGVNQNLPLYPNVGLGAAEGGRIGYEPGGVVEPGKQYYGKEDWEIQQINKYGVSYPEFLQNQFGKGLHDMDASEIATAVKAWDSWRSSQADGGIARLL